MGQIFENFLFFINFFKNYMNTKIISLTKAPSDEGAVTPCVTEGVKK